MYIKIVAIKMFIKSVLGHKVVTVHVAEQTGNMRRNIVRFLEHIQQIKFWQI